MVLGVAPAQSLGRLSYSLYLWHWPILVLAAEYQGRGSLPLSSSWPWVLVALAVSVLSYRLVENPIRHARVLRARRWVSVALGVTITLVALGVMAVRSNLAGASVAPQVVAGTAPSRVRQLVADSNQVQEVPADLSGVLADPQASISLPPARCFVALPISTAPACVFGDRTGTKTMVLYGDSHAGMWFRALDDIATSEQWRLVVLTKPSCPADPLSVHPKGVIGRWVACDKWHQYAMARIKALHPSMVIVSQAPWDRYTPEQWKHGLETLFDRVHTNGTEDVVLGNIPPSQGPNCLSRHTNDVQACSVPLRAANSPYDAAEQLATASVGGRYVTTTPWFCAKTCSAVIAGLSAYSIPNHVSASYSVFLESTLAAALGLSPLPSPLPS